MSSFKEVLNKWKALNSEPLNNHDAQDIHQTVSSKPEQMVINIQRKNPPPSKINENINAQRNRNRVQPPKPTMSMASGVSQKDVKHAVPPTQPASQQSSIPIDQSELLSHTQCAPIHSIVNKASAVHKPVDAEKHINSSAFTKISGIQKKPDTEKPASRPLKAQTTTKVKDVVPVAQHAVSPSIIQPTHTAVQQNPAIIPSTRVSGLRSFFENSIKNSSPLSDLPKGRMKAISNRQVKTPALAPQSTPHPKLCPLPHPSSKAVTNAPQMTQPLESVELQECSICMEDQKLVKFSSRCAHGANSCVGCLSKWIVSMMSPLQVDIKCPDCTIIGKYADLVAILGTKSPDLEQYNRYKSNIELTRLQSSSSSEESSRYRFIYCAHCREILSHENTDFVKCRSCQQETCVQHSLPREYPLAHRRRTMDMNNAELYCCAYGRHEMERRVEEQSRRKNENIASESLIAQYARQCPRCTVPIEKNGGCAHMKCSRCGHEFFWCCLRSYRDPEEARTHRQRCP